MALAAVLTVVFVGIESRSPAPLAPLRVFRSGAGRGQPRALRARHDGVSACRSSSPGTPRRSLMVSDPLRARIGRHAGHGRDRNLRRASNRHQARGATGRGRRHGAHRARQRAADSSLGRRNLPRRPLLRPADPRPRHRRRVRRGLDRGTDRRRRDRSWARLRPEQRLLPARRRGGRGQPVVRRRVRRPRRRSPRGAHQPGPRLPRRSPSPRSGWWRRSCCSGGGASPRPSPRPSRRSHDPTDSKETRHDRTQRTPKT